MTDLQKIVELGKRATPRPLVIGTDVGSYGWPVFRLRDMNKTDREGIENDRLYLEAAANSADIMAQQLLDIEKLDKEFPNLHLVFRERLREILGRQG